MTNHSEPQNPDRGGFDAAALEELLCVLTDGTLSAEQGRRLADLMRGSAAARAFYRDYLAIHVELRRELGSPPAPLLPDLLEPSAEPHLVEHDRLSIARRVSETWQSSADRVQHSISMRMAVSLLLTVAGIAALIAWITPRGSNGPVGQSGEPVIAANLTRLSDVTWSEDAARWRQGVSLAAGRRLQLASGLAELTFVDGATVILQGPCDFTVDATGAGTLNRGELLAIVPRKAVGFSIDTPKAHVVDLGTRFAISVVDEATSMHVVEGRIRATQIGDAAEPPVTVELIAGQSARFGQSVKRFATPDSQRKRLLALDRKARARKIRDVTIHDVSSELVHSGGFDRPAAHLIDGSGLVGQSHSPIPDAGTPAGANPGNMWLTTGGPNDTLPAHVTFDLGAPYDLSRLHIWNYNEQFRGLFSRGARDVVIRVSPTSDEASLVRLQPLAGGEHFVFPRADGKATYRGFILGRDAVANADALDNVRYVRFDILSNHGSNPGDENPDYVGLSEVQFFAAPVERRNAN